MKFMIPFETARVPEALLKSWLITDLSKMTYEEDLDLVEEPTRFVLRSV